MGFLRKERGEGRRVLKRMENGYEKRVVWKMANGIGALPTVGAKVKGRLLRLADNGQIANRWRLRAPSGKL